MSNAIKTNNFLTLGEYYKSKSILKSKSPLLSKISIFRGDITNLKVDAIVNAANKDLLGGGGAIHRKAGKKLLQECRNLGGCQTGEAKITQGYNLPAKFVIHTVGPIGEKEQDLANCYWNSLEIAMQNDCKHIVFPCISTGVYGYPNEPAAHVALGTCNKWLQTNPDKIDLVVFCTFLEIDFTIYKDIISAYFSNE
ncbi:O-acetyl-ADP-ribose deacetylase macrod2 [Terramyces sp. JEL0728]|nr:O-acetyl-ADP-ribose deacetylase macrod2 [Terramyces sp. JEL0728]